MDAVEYAAMLGVNFKYLSSQGNVICLQPRKMFCLIRNVVSIVHRGLLEEVHSTVS